MTQTKKRAPRVRRSTGRRPVPPVPESQLRQVWLAGLGAVAATQETAVGIVDLLVARGKRQEPATIAAAEKAVREARGAVVGIAREATQRSKKLVDGAIDRLGATTKPREKNILHRLGDLAEALL